MLLTDSQPDQYQKLRRHNYSLDSTIHTDNFDFNCLIMPHYIVEHFDVWSQPRNLLLSRSYSND